ncbi:MAG: GrpB family protein [bacterium]
MRSIVVVDYDPAWPAVFEQLRARLRPALSDPAWRIEHVGSTSVPGLAAKPVIDLSVVVPAANALPPVIERLAGLDYIHLGELGVEGREAFRCTADLPAHNLYACPQGSLGLVNQLAVRDYLRAHAETAQAYAALKRRLAEQFPHDIDSYVDGKTDLLLDILTRAGIDAGRLAAIERANRKPAGGATR